jgi:hypothetical protein
VQAGFFGSCQIWIAILGRYVQPTPFDLYVNGQQSCLAVVAESPQEVRCPWKRRFFLDSHLCKAFRLPSECVADVLLGSSHIRLNLYSERSFSYIYPFELLEGDCTIVDIYD